MILEKTNNFSVEAIGYTTDYVYDIEVDDTHCFFANDILVHNSIYIRFKELIQFINKYPSTLTKDKIINFLDKYGSKVIQPLMDDAFEKIAVHTNSMKNKMVMKREAIAESTIIRAKKNYIMLVNDNEGIRYTEPKLKMMGVETAKSGTPKFIKNALEDCYLICLSGKEEEFKEYVKEFHKEFMNKDYRELCPFMGVNNIDKYKNDEKVKNWESGTPFHVKAAISHNNGLVKYNISHALPISDGDKIQLAMLKEPNHFFTGYMAFIDSIPEEFELNGFIDYQGMYEKQFLNPVTSISKLLKWNHESKNDVKSALSFW